MTFILLFIFQATILKGKVYDITNFKPIEADIFFSNTVQQCDLTGSFQFYDLLPGNYRLIVSHVGYKTESLSVRLEKNDEKFLSIGLQNIPIIFKEVKVKAKKIPKSEVKVVTKEEIVSIPGGEKDLYKAVQVMPGVSSPSDYLNLAYVRGGELYENLTLLDETEVLLPYHYFGVSSTFNTTLVENFDFLTGIFPARYGDVISSILNIKTKNYSNIKPQVNIETNLMESDWTYSHAFNDKSYILFSARRSYLDLILGKFIQGESFILPYYTDFQGKLGLNFKNDHIVLNVLNSKNETSLKADFSDYPLDLKIKELGNSLGLNWERTLSENIKLGAGLFHTAASRKLFGAIPSLRGQTEEKLTKSKNRFQTKANFDFAQFEYEIGAGLGNLDYYHTGPRIEDLLYTEFFYQYDLSVDTADNDYFAYVIQKSELLKPFYTEFGLRAEKLPLTKKWLSQPRIVFSYVKSPYEIYLGGSVNYHTAALEYKHDNYEPINSRIVTSGISYEIGKTLFGKLGLYYKQYHNLITFDSLAGNFSYNGKGFARGIEITLHKSDEQRFFGWLSYAFSAAKRSTPYDEEVIFFQVDRTHILNLVLGTHLPKSVTFTASFKLASGTPYYKLIGRTRGSIGWEACWSPTQVRWPYYQRLDIKFGKDFRISRVKGEVYLSIINLLNRKNIQAGIYDASVTRVKYYYMFPRIPLLGLDLEF
jgi:hypothetical protein